MSASSLSTRAQRYRRAIIPPFCARCARARPSGRCATRFSSAGGNRACACQRAQEESFLPFYNAGIHMDGLTTTGRQGGDRELKPSSLFGNKGPEDLELFQKHYCAYISHGSNPGRHAENYGTNGGMMFQDPDHRCGSSSCRLSTENHLVCLRSRLLLLLQPVYWLLHAICRGLPQ